MPLPILDFALDGGNRIDALGDEIGEVGADDVRVDVRNQAIDVRRDQIQHLLRHGREPADAQVGAHDDDGNLHAPEQVDQVAVQAAQLLVPAMELFVDRVQFFV